MNNVMTNSSRDNVNANSAPAMITGKIYGSVTRPECLRRVRAQVRRGPLQRVVEIEQPCSHDQDHERRRQHDVADHDVQRVG